jgi:putative oxidoreductase
MFPGVAVGATVREEASNAIPGRHHMQSSSMNNAALLIARILLAAIFIKGGWDKYLGYQGTVGYMGKAGVPGSLLPLVIFTEFVGGLLILVGWQTRWAAIALAGFTILAALLFHWEFGNRGQEINFYKNLAIAGGFLALFVSGAGAYSVEGRRSA